MIRFSLSLLILVGLIAGIPMRAGALERTIGPSGEPVPRFASLKADEVNVRQGPGRGHKIKWVFKKLGLPVKIISEYEEWREIEDHAGATGWVFQGLLSRRRTAVTLDPQLEGKAYISLYEEAEATGTPIAQLGKDVIGHVLTCTGAWCRLAINKKLKGWVLQSHLWGLFDKEPFKGQ